MPTRLKPTLSPESPAVFSNHLARRVAELESEQATLTETIAELEREIEAIETSFASQELLVLDGYLVAVRRGINVPFAARCPKLRAIAQGETVEQTLAELREEMAFFLAYRSEAGKPIPPKDVEA